jgi:tetratricopeptide (TPR) repeat protein
MPGYALHYAGQLKVGYQYLQEALQISEQTDDKWLMGWSCAFLTWTCVDLGLFDEALHFGEKGEKIIKMFLSSDQELFFVLTAGVGFAYFYKGCKAETLAIGRTLEDFGHKYSNSRMLSMGYFYIAASHLIAGSFHSAMETAKKGILAAKEPMFAQNLKIILGLSYCLGGEFEQAEDPLREVVRYSKKFGYRTVEVPAYGFLGLVLISKGQMNSGLKIIKEARQTLLENGYRWGHATFEQILGKIYSQIVEGSTPLSISIVAKNLGFLLRSVPFASRKAENHFKKAIEVAKEIGAKGILGQAYLDLGLLHKAKKRTDYAQDCFSEAIKIFEQCEADRFLKQATEALASLG